MKITGIILCILFVFIMFGMTVSTSVNTPRVYADINSVTATTAPPPPIALEIELSEPPVLGETVEVTFTVSIDKLWDGEWEGRLTEDLAQSRAWVQFSWVNIHGSYLEALNYRQIPLVDLSASSNMSWQGNALENRSIIIRSSFQIPFEGLWVINGYFSTSNWRTPQKPGDGYWPPLPKPFLTHWMRYAVAEGYAVNNTSTYSLDFKNSPLNYFDSSMPWGGGEKTFDDSGDKDRPLIMQLNISKPPRVGEEVTISCRIESFFDEQDFSTKIYISKDNMRIFDPGLSDLFVDGSLIWSGDLKAQTPVLVSATIKFPQEGRWHIQLEGTTPERAAELFRFAESIEFTITGDKSYYGITEIKNTQEVKIQRGCQGPVYPTTITTPSAKTSGN
jgi:hypothetical protein